jgi:hypothetical protein
MACGTCGSTSKKSNSCSCKSKSYTSSIKYDGEKLVCNKDEENKFTIRSCSKLNDVIATLAENICELWNSAISVDYISNVELEGTVLNFTGVGNAFNGPIDLSALGGGGDSLYNSDNIFTGGAVLNERTVNMANYKIGWINNSQWGIGVAANAVGVSTEVGGINDTTAQFHVAGAIRTDNWYHGRYGLLLHQTGEVTNTFCGFQVGLNVIPSPANGVWNTAYGYLALREVTTGYANTAIGHSALRRNLTGDKNIAIGENSLTTSTDTQNCTAIGSYALNQLTTGSSNVAIGNNSQELNINGVQNVSVGVFSLRANISGGANTAIGQFSLYEATDTESNTAIGHFSMGFNTFSGSYNVAVGRDSLKFSTGDSNVSLGRNNSTFGSGSNNTSIGAYALGETNTDTLLNDNIAIGIRAGQKINTSSNNIFIGVSSQGGGVTKRVNLTNLILIGSAKPAAAGYSVGADALTNSISIANNISNSNQIRIGNITDHTSAEIPVPWTVTSDERFKNIDSNGNIPGLDFVMQLNPIRYKLKNIETGLNREEKSRYGFSAQQVISIEGEDIVIGDNSDLEHLKLRESMIIPVLVKAIKELKQEINTLKLNNNLQ